jgi:two-component system, OmpR family, KDP operon response regulator KdpE
MVKTVLIAEDERSIASVVALGVHMIWPECEVKLAASGEEALQFYDEAVPDLVVLDISMPPPDGFELCKYIRSRSQVPILMLTGKTSTLDKVRALDLGADDYLTKPFDALELLARLRALDRRASFNRGPAQQNGRNGHSGIEIPDVVIGDVALNTRTRKVTVGGQPVTLTSTEYRLLEELMRNAGSVLPHDLLIQRVWGEEYAGEEHYLKVFVRRLRRKLGDDARNPRYLQNEWGVGYRFVGA